MISDNDRYVLLDNAEQSPWRLPNGGWLVISARLVDQSDVCPHGLDYALVLQDENKQRVLGFDNSHGYDGAAADAPFDHEHPASNVNKRLPYAFSSVGHLITDFFERCEAYCKEHGIPFELQPEHSDER